MVLRALLTVLLAVSLITTPAAAQPTDPGPVDDVASFVGDVLSGVVDTVNGVGDTIGNVIRGVTQSPDSVSFVSGEVDVSEEQVQTQKAMDELESRLNNEPGIWTIGDRKLAKDNATQYETIGVYVHKEVGDKDHVVRNYTVRINWSNVSYENGTAQLNGTVVNITKGAPEDADLRVYPTYETVMFFENKFPKIVESETTAQVATDVWSRVDNTRCEPVEDCKELKGSYSDLIDFAIGRLT